MFARQHLMETMQHESVNARVAASAGLSADALEAIAALAEIGSFMKRRVPSDNIAKVFPTARSTFHGFANRKPRGARFSVRESG